MDILDLELVGWLFTVGCGIALLVGTWLTIGMQLSGGGGPVSAADAAMLDEVCAVTADSGIAASTLAEVGARDGLRVPPAVTSFDPNGGPPRQVDVSRTLGD